MSERNHRSGTWDDLADEAPEQPFKPLTPEQAKALRVAHPPISPWRVIAVQAVVGGVVAVLAWLLFGKQSLGWSALYGAAAVVLPGALMVRGMRRFPVHNPSAALLGFAVWELMKIVLAVAMLVAAALWLPQLSWPALLVAMVLCTKVSWVALLWRGRVKKTP